GDLIMSRFGTVSDIGQNPLLSTLNKADRDKLQLLRDEAHARLRGSVERQIGNKVPLQILNLAPSVDKAVLVEKSTNRLYVYERTNDNTPPRLVHDYYISTGKKRGDKKVRGDLKTPEGVYFVTSWIPDEKLPSKYGVGAFPVNYPNEYDQRIGKTGSGIWLHGTDNGYYSRPPLDSEGCVVLTNIDLKTVMDEITPGVTPVVITEKANWVNVSDWKKQRQEVLTALEQWRKDWSSLDVERFLSHYDQNFWTSNGHDLQSWKTRKRNVVRNKTYQRIKLSDISLLSYPESEGRPAMIVARFRQQYDSNNYKGDIHKRIYLRKQGDQWRIMYEGA
ncbi:MAG: L,D-transpeptidase family protein, partial [Gammaproteobacteria bacterium]|nr:L,D-transpeptidase family protein [Gammaproteobacteria bacterium]